MRWMSVSAGTICSLLVTSGALAAGPVGLSIYLQDGVAEPINIVDNERRFVDELDITATVTTATDEGIDPVIQSGDLSTLDWTGVELADEEWKPAGDGSGTFVRERFYRNAAWMENPSTFVISQVDGDRVLPNPGFETFAGYDDFKTVSDDGAIRRFFARQVTTGCTDIGDCSTATSFTAQALVQLRQAIDPKRESRKISKKADALRIVWTADPTRIRQVPIQHVRAQDSEYGYGFDVEVEATTPPANGQYYVPGEAITFTLGLYDGDRNALDANGMLPTYADFLAGQALGGLRYFDLFLNPTLFYALKHREGNLLLSMGGPSQSFKVTENIVPVSDFFLPQTQSVFSAEYGYSAVVVGVPAFTITFGGLFDPGIWQTPITNQATIVVPDDALPGTYVVSLKARRDFAGEAINEGDVIRLQVGTEVATAWEPTTGNCETCHAGPTALENVLHGIGDRESCLNGCHVSIGNEPDNALDYRVHFVHTRTDRLGADAGDCLLCHFDPPTDDPRGYPGFGFPFAE